MEEYVKAEDFGEDLYAGRQEKPFNFKEKIEKFLGSIYWNIAVIIFIAIIFFSLGRLWKVEGERQPVKVLGGSNAVSNNIAGDLAQTASTVNAGNSDSIVVASKNGTKYHYPWCAGAKQISAKNLITFNSIEDARAAGYTPASNCKGLK